MNNRVGLRREPVKRLQLRPGDLQEKYPASLWPSPLLVRCWQISLAAETTTLALAAWLRQRSQMCRQVINDGLLRLAFRERTRRYGARFIEWLSRTFRRLWHGLVNFGDTGLRMSRNGLHAIASWLRSQQTGARQQNRSASDYPALRFEACSTGPRFSRLLSQREEALRRELTRSHARLVEELRAEEEELTRVATKVVRLQSLIRSQEDLLEEMVDSHEDQQESSLFLAGFVDNLAGIGKSSGRNGSQNMPLFRRN